MTQQGGVTTPTVSFSTLAKIMGQISPVALASKLRDHKFPSEGMKRSYQNALKHAVDHLTTGIQLDPQSPGLRSHEQEAIAALATMGLSLPSGAQALRPRRGPQWALAGVNISMYPDAHLTGPNGDGAIKFSFGKERLGRGVGTAMAALVWHYRTQILGHRNVQPSLCIVCEPRVGATYRPGTNPAAQVRNATVACQVIAAVWATL